MSDELPERLTDEEREILDLLSQAFNKFKTLPIQHPMHQGEFATSIHQSQRLIMSRVVARQEGWVKPCMDGTTV